MLSCMWREEKYCGITGMKWLCDSCVIFIWAWQNDLRRFCPTFVPCGQHHTASFRHTAASYSVKMSPTLLYCVWMLILVSWTWNLGLKSVNKDMRIFIHLSGNNALIECLALIDVCSLLSVVQVSCYVSAFIWQVEVQRKAGNVKKRGYDNIRISLHDYCCQTNSW